MVEKNKIFIQSQFECLFGHVQAVDVPSCAWDLPRWCYCFIFYFSLPKNQTHALCILQRSSQSKRDFGQNIFTVSLLHTLLPRSPSLPDSFRILYHCFLLFQSSIELKHELILTLQFNSCRFGGAHQKKSKRKGRRGERGGGGNIDLEVCDCMDY